MRQGSSAPYQASQWSRSAFATSTPSLSVESLQQTMRHNTKCFLEGACEMGKIAKAEINGGFGDLFCAAFANAR
ncbi:hypothetical protein B0G73_13613 [Paraburkholderia sp. BL25I1N1]|nr:hypothetical protein B0G73_13613 [Paraburkholderia sp. BL25I1N1]